MTLLRPIRNGGTKGSVAVRPSASRAWLAVMWGMAGLVCVGCATAMVRSEAESFQDSLTTHTIQSYRNFLYAWPNGAHQSEARRRSDHIETELKRAFSSVERVAVQITWRDGPPEGPYGPPRAPDDPRFEKFVSALVRTAGLTLVDEAHAADAIVSVRINCAPLSAQYGQFSVGWGGEQRFSGAEVAGDVTVSVGGNVVDIWGYSGELVPAHLVAGNEFKKPSEAPFYECFLEHSGFLSEFAGMIERIRGEGAALRVLLADDACFGSALQRVASPHLPHMSDYWGREYLVDLAERGLKSSDERLRERSARVVECARVRH